MFQFIPVSEKDIVAVKVSGKLTDNDYQDFLPHLTTLIHKYAPLSMLIELEDFRGWEPKALWDDFKFDKHHTQDFKRIAIVGQHIWEKWMTVFGKAFLDAEIRFFSQDQLQDAWEWLRSEDDESKVTEGLSSLEDLLQHMDEEPKSYENILVPIDFSPYSLLAVKRARQLARQHNANLTLLHVLEDISYNSFYGASGFELPFDYDEDGFEKIEQAQFDHADSRMKQIKESLNYPKAHYEVLWGLTKPGILSFVEAQNIDLIVAGSHGKHGIARLLGSTANGIVHGARCDVFVVRLSD